MNSRDHGGGFGQCFGKLLKLSKRIEKDNAVGLRIDQVPSKVLLVPVVAPRVGQ